MSEPPKVVLARKGDERDGGIAKLTDAIAHGDRVLVARESGEMAMKDQQNRSAPMVSQSPPPALLVEQVDVRGTVARLDAHTIASPNWNNIEGVRTQGGALRADRAPDLAAESPAAPSSNPVADGV